MSDIGENKCISAWQMPQQRHFQGYLRNLTKPFDDSRPHILPPPQLFLFFVNASCRTEEKLERTTIHDNLLPCHIELVSNHTGETGSPMYYAACIMRTPSLDAKIVFIGHAYVCVFATDIVNYTHAGKWLPSSWISSEQTWAFPPYYSTLQCAPRSSLPIQAERDGERFGIILKSERDSP